jgi:hypothetical protein
LIDGQLTALALLERGPSVEVVDALIKPLDADELVAVLAGFGDIAHLLTLELAEQLGIESRLVVAQVRAIYESALGLRANNEEN